MKQEENRSKERKKSSNNSFKSKIINTDNCKMVNLVLNTYQKKGMENIFL